MKGESCQQTLILYAMKSLSECVYGVVVLFSCLTGCGEESDQVAVPSVFVGGRIIHLGDTFEDVVDRDSISKSEVDDAYFEDLDGAYFDRISYRLHWGRIEEMELFAQTVSVARVEDVPKIFEICRKEYGDSIRVQDDSTNEAHVRTWVWKTGDQSFAWLHCSVFKDEKGKYTRIGQIMLYLGRDGEWEGLRSWDPSAMIKVE